MILKQGQERAFSVLFRCDSSEQIGLGHLSRCLGLAKELQERYGCQIAFAMRPDPVGNAMVAEGGYPVVMLSDGESRGDYSSKFQQVCQSLNGEMVILDVRDDLPRRTVQSLWEEGRVIVTLDDPTDRRLDVDLAFYPPVPQVKQLDWTGFKGHLYVGWEWVLLRPEFARTLPKHPHSLPHVLVTMGGSDPLRMTEKTVKALDSLPGGFTVTFVLGRAYGEEKLLQEILSQARFTFEVRRDVREMSSLMAEADLAIASFGVTAYELAAMGVPGLYLCLTPDHAESATAFELAGIGQSLGLYDQGSVSRLAQAMEALLTDEPRRAQLAKQARQTIDGRGVFRIGEILFTRLSEKHEFLQTMATS